MHRLRMPLIQMQDLEKMTTTMTTGAVAESLLFLMPEDGRRFVVRDTSCDSLEIDAEDRPVEGAPSIRTSIDADTWRELSSGDRSPAEQRLVEAFIADLDDQSRALLRERFDACKEHMRRIASHVVPVEDILDGVLVFYTEVVSERRSVFNGGDISGFSITHEGTTYLIEDLYCSNPECDCRKVDFVVGQLRETSEGRALEDSFRASWSFSSRGPRVDEASGCSKSVARAILSAWRKDDPDLADTFRQRYEDVQGIGRRSLAGAPSLPAVDRATSRSRPASKQKVGRNEPCPCRSGRKYKKCCGKDVTTA